MLKRLIACAAVASTVNGTALADDATFTYTGFLLEPTFYPDWTMSGSFSGTDADRDGTIELGELNYFRWDHLTYVGEEACMNYTYCQLLAFSYTPGGQLSFETELTYSDVIMWFTGNTVSGQYYRHGPTLLQWTDQTRFDIDFVPAVPEPPGSVLVLGGAAILMAARRLRTRQRPLNSATSAKG